MVDKIKKTVALFGGSFNPPHEGHLGMASYIHHTLDVDETWMLFSESPEKDPKAYVSLQHRINMAEILARHYDAKLVMSDQEAKIADDIGRHETYYILDELGKRFPDHKFIWVMGADTFTNFHRWNERDDILNNYTVAVVNRPGFKEMALLSPTAIDFRHTCIDATKPGAVTRADHGWCFLNSPEIPVSSTDILTKLKSGITDFNGPFSDVADYIYEHGLYQTNTMHTQTNQLRLEQK